MLIKNAKIEDSDSLNNILIENGKIIRIGANINEKAQEVLDVGGRLVLPPFIDSHLHLDTTFSVDALKEATGTLYGGIEQWVEFKKNLTVDDIKKRAKKAVSLEVQRGVQYIRTHVDVSDEKLTALKAMLELKSELKDIVSLQIIAFPQEGILSFKNGKELLEEAIMSGVDGIGAIPHYEFTREYSVESINYIVELALKHNVLIDAHCDETDDESSRGIETLAARALETGLRGRVTASHATAMQSYSDAYTSRLFRVLQMSGINIVANPLVNIHLQGRFETYPKRRGMTRVKELDAAGINVSFGQDDIRDPWYPIGSGNMIDAVFMGLHIGHLLEKKEIERSYRFITHNAAKTLDIKNYGIKEGNPADFVVLDSDNFSDTLSQRKEVLYSIRGGRILAQNKTSNEMFVKI